MLTFGERLRIAREHSGLNQTDFGNRVGLSQGQISKLERIERAKSLSNQRLLIAGIIAVLILVAIINAR